MNGVATSQADVFAFSELEAASVNAISADARGYGYSALPSDPETVDVGILSRYPIIESDAGRWLARVVVAPPSTRPLVIYAVHAPLARFVEINGLRIGVDLTVRDAVVSAMRARIDYDIAQGRTVVVMGDLNSTERERGYAEMAAGLRDSHLEAGTGPGLTWRPTSVIPVGLLRIDYIFSTPDMSPTSSTVDCSLPSDHCRVDATLTIMGAP